MAEQVQATAITITPNEQPLVEFKEFDAAGKIQVYKVPLPVTQDFNQWTLMQQVMMLKQGIWEKLSIYDIIWGLHYAKSRGADVTQGDLFPTGKGRFGESNGFRRKLALRTGNVIGIETSFKELDDDLPAAAAKCIRKKDLECTATIYVKDWPKPIVKRQRLSRWYNEKNPNWVSNPENMLEESTVGHACRWVPGVDSGSEEEAPPIMIDASVPSAAGVAAQLRGNVTPILDGDNLEPQLKASIKMVEEKKAQLDKQFDNPADTQTASASGVKA
jgi:hypothetical protein